MSLSSKASFLMLFILFRKFIRLWEYREQWSRKWLVVSISWPQEQMGLTVSWKLWLNLCSRRWLNPSLSLVKNIKPLGWWQLKTLFGVGLIKLKIFFLKTEKLSALRILASKMFHSFIEEGKKVFLKNHDTLSKVEYHKQIWLNNDYCLLESNWTGKGMLG